MKRFLLPLISLLIVGLVLSACGGKPPAKNSIGGSTTNQLTRCTPSDTTHACAQVQETKHPTQRSIPALPAPRVVPRPANPAPKAPHAQVKSFLADTVQSLTLSNGSQGIDFAWSCPDPNGVYGGHTVQFAFSYVSTDSSKNWSKGCIDWWLNNHKSVGINWETYADRATAGYDAGYSDAKEALSQANYLLPGGSEPIFFSIDCDCSYGQVASYFQGADAAIGVNRVGAYGGYYPIVALFSNRLITYGWQAYAWSYGNWSQALLEQWLNGDAWDYDRAIGSAYQGLYPIPPPPDPYAIFPKTVYTFSCREPASFGVCLPDHASEYNTVKTWDSAGCKNPPQREVCKTSRYHLQLLLGRIYFVAHNQLVNGKWVKLSKPRWGYPNKSQPLGSRYQLILHRLQK